MSRPLSAASKGRVSVLEVWYSQSRIESSEHWHVAEFTSQIKEISEQYIGRCMRCHLRAVWSRTRGRQGEVDVGMAAPSYPIMVWKGTTLNIAAHKPGVRHAAQITQEI
jgi:hypothetical protein